MIGVNGPGFPAATTRLWRLAIFTAAGAFGTTGHAEAALYYWPDYSAGAYYSRQPSPEMQRPKARKRNAVSKKDVAEKETGAKPQGPLVIAVSIERQKVTVYDSNGVFAESPVSTGMKGHSTPMGVFSVIQKHKFHHSNIYSGAPMPYMQRITWSGVAMHAGVLPGYPASHGCIRMPMAFAVKMWNWTKMGARVVVAPGEMSPHSFSHPLLATLRVPPQPAASIEPQTNVADKADKGAEIKSASAEPLIELRSSVGHVVSDATTGNALARADMPIDKASVEDAPQAESTKTADASDAVKPQAAEAPAKTDEAIAKPADVASAEAKPADTADAPKTSSVEKPADKIEPTTAQADATKSEPAKSERAKAEALEVKKPDAAATATAPVQPDATDARKDQTRVADPAPVAKPEPPKRAGQIAVFISRKDSKLYVRQNFAPLFDVPVTIAASDRPLGTHVFTAEVDKADSNALHWSVVSLPVNVRSAEREDEGRTARRQRMTAAVIPVAAKPVIVPNSPAEALDRIQVPADTMAKINEMLTTGGSIIVSDQGINQGETGEGTDFIVRLR
ncbi:L,D-transpeptidase [Bradyrhizobium liaoningense]|uniref:L,D-transpeptidase n=1 Tax=Bradyrhizobium liaoningense TaxID=43992 RepID=UPI001BA51F53|nr:L,D-transpeptidase [Bradyrhizobium liaoningense]MBR0713819.1 L,D-transpeptidase family protein [Bradyrhizobium liaoningense]